MERGDNGKFIKSATPAASTSGKDASGTGETAYEEPVESLATPVAATSMPALPSDAGTTGAEDAPIKNDDSADGRARVLLRSLSYNDILFCPPKDLMSSDIFGQKHARFRTDR